MINYIRFRLSQEPRSERINRLNRIHDRLVCEATEEREHRPSVIRNRLTDETSERRQHRLDVINKRIGTKLPSQRTQRLAAKFKIDNSIFQNKLLMLYLCARAHLRKFRVVKERNRVQEPHHADIHSPSRENIIQSLLIGSAAALFLRGPGASANRGLRLLASGSAALEMRAPTTLYTVRVMKSSV
ncbi:hypothetical protein EVAR_61061_1 [Eumeta japonica]|uniref:Uncharacterized protein n=1 Tax=Eumeta variegata TaxID=151549 RepID=A0A4C1ZAM5_EUMVA|nr:hypothetical protein EVAR_61061_1 [Eumeta japonica]